MAAARARGAPVDFTRYPNAFHPFDAHHMALHPLSACRMANGVVPLIGTDEAARADALVRVPEFLGGYLKDR